MSQSEVVEIPYHLIADPNAPEVSPSGSGQANPQDTRRNITVPGTHTIYDLYNELIQTLRDTHRFITIQFPCTVPEPNPNGEHEEDHQNPSHTERAPEWKDLVGHSGYQYDPSLKIEDLQSCWPRQEVHTKLQPIQVVAIPKDRVETLPHLADETEEQLKSRLHLMGSMYDLFYAQRKGRVIWMPTLDSQFETPRKVWIRSCWQEFQIGIIANFMRIHSKKTYKKKDLKKLKKRYFADKCHQPSTDDTELWKSIQETPEWIARDGADVSPFRGLINSETLIDNDCCKAFYLNGQPGTGKSLMLLYLIHCLMKEVDKVVCIFSSSMLSSRFSTFSQTCQ
ncbi:hypothetical protein BLNAU_10427 [Blattamonas nauphoetae]|uniref:Uncharacterized protein n=1 Tax=Blattamonas nauphoetae TaxID=2049346 RepID=A0ABQ9XQ67_9EUKA|nr:hypothetical protein BLNAU_10427 [Blattamonas nauphoetae]